MKMIKKKLKRHLIITINSKLCSEPNHPVNLIKINHDVKNIQIAY